jgi:hypothetical protein
MLIENLSYLHYYYLDYPEPEEGFAERLSLQLKDFFSVFLLVDEHQKSAYQD